MKVFHIEIPNYTFGFLPSAKQQIDQSQHVSIYSKIFFFLCTLIRLLFKKKINQNETKQSLLMFYTATLQLFFLLHSNLVKFICFILNKFLYMKEDFFSESSLPFPSLPF